MESVAWSPLRRLASTRSFSFKDSKLKCVAGFCSKRVFRVEAISLRAGRVSLYSLDSPLFHLLCYLFAYQGIADPASCRAFLQQRGGSVPEPTSSREFHCCRQTLPLRGARRERDLEGRHGLRDLMSTSCHGRSTTKWRISPSGTQRGTHRPYPRTSRFYCCQAEGPFQGAALPFQSCEVQSMVLSFGLPLAVTAR